MLSRSQGIFFATAINGHNIVLTGQGGSGKTFVVKMLAKELAAHGKCVSVTCSTGIAATQYENGQTQHRWCGIGDGGIPKSELTQLLAQDERYAQAKARIEKCNVLIIDECSMVSLKMFETVEFLCRSVKGNENFFGGIQVILSGDFYQLPPVPDSLYGESGRYCFECSYFLDAIPHHISLDTVFRQKHNDFISCVNEIEQGTPSKCTLEYLNLLKREITQTEKTIHLFSTNFKTKLFNHDRLKTMPGEVKLYRAKDEGDSYYLNSFQAPTTLGLKVNCPVMLVVNLSENLVNGTSGKVKDLSDDHVTVLFDKPNKLIKLDRHLFTKSDPVSRRTLSKRLQFPLILCFGITIHKSQGMTLESVVVDCENASIPGQIGVAIGRVISPENLQIKNFKPSLVKEHPLNVYKFYNTQSKMICQDCSCCKGQFIPLHVQKDLFTPFDVDIEETFHGEDYGCGGAAAAADDDDDDDDGDDVVVFDNNGDDGDDDDVHGDGVDNTVTEIDPIKENSDFSDENLSYEMPDPLPDYIEPIQLLKNIHDEYKETPVEDLMSQLYKEILSKSEPLFTWITSLFLKLNKIGEDSFLDGELCEQKDVTKFCSHVNTFLKSNEYFESSKTFYGFYGEKFERVGQYFCTSVAFRLQSIIIEKKVKLISTAEVQERVVPNEKSEEGKGNVRYIGGYCISKLKFSFQKQVQTSLYDPKKESILQICRKKLLLLSQLTISYSDLASSTSHFDTLKTTSRKQNVRQGLTNITDAAFMFFMNLNKKIREIETFENLHTYGQLLIEKIRMAILNDKDIFEIWLDLFKDSNNEPEFTSDDEDAIARTVCYITELFNEIVAKFIKVSASHFRKDYLLFVKREKGKAHRKKVMEKKLEKNVKKVSLDEIENDKTAGKIVTHLKLKAGVLADNKYFNDKFYSKKDLIKLCEAYEIPTLSKHNKQHMNDQLIEVIKQCEFMLTPQAFASSAISNVRSEKDRQCENDSVREGTSNDCENEKCLDRKGKGKGKRKGKENGKSKSLGKVKRTKNSNACGKAKKKKVVNDEEEIDDDNRCSICSGKYDESPDWICCDTCDKWYHGHCVGINTSKEWEKYADESVGFICPFCN